MGIVRDLYRVPMGIVWDSNGFCKGSLWDL